MMAAAFACGDPLDCAPIRNDPDLVLIPCGRNGQTRLSAPRSPPQILSPSYTVAPVLLEPSVTVVWMRF